MVLEVPVRALRHREKKVKDSKEETKLALFRDCTKVKGLTDKLLEHKSLARLLGIKITM